MRTFFSNSLLGNSAGIFAIRFVTILANLFGIVYYSHQLAQEQYGQYVFLFTCMAVFVALGSIGMGATVFNFSDTGFKKFIKALPTSSKWNYAGFLIVVSTIFVLVLQYNDFPIFEWHHYLLFAGFLLMAVLCFVMDNILLLFRLLPQQLLLNLAFSTLLIYGHIYAINTGKQLDLLLLICIWTFALVLKLVTQLLLFRRELQQKENPLMDLSEIQASRKTWLQMGFYEVFQALVKQTDRFVVGSFLGSKVMATYFNGRIDIPFIPAILSSVRNAALINLSKGKEDTPTILKTIKHTFQILSAVCFAVAAFGIIYSEEILSVVFSEKYLDAKNIFIWSLLILPAQYCISLTYVLQYKDKADIINKGAFIDLFVSIVLLYPMYQWMGLSGIAAAVVISTYIQSIYYWLHSSKTLRIHFLTLIPWKAYFINIVLSFGLAIASHYLFELIFAPSFVLLFGSMVGILSLTFMLRIFTKQK